MAENRTALIRDDEPDFRQPQRGQTRLRFWGVRGSIPTPGPGTVRYGGNTSCVELRVEGQLIILDAGSGLRLLGRELVREFQERPLEISLLLTHTHWDHIQGLPFFQPVYRQQDRIHILGCEGARRGLEKVLSNQMESPFFPVGLREVPANLKIDELQALDFELGCVRVDAFFANHPGVCVGYRLFCPGASIAFFPDHEPFAGFLRSPRAEVAPREDIQFAREEDQKMVEFLRGTDVLIMDAQYDCEEYRDHVGWGHACLDDVVQLAASAQVKRLFLFHHDPDHDDEKVDSMVRHARELVTSLNATIEVEAAREGLEVVLG